jgi:hypothetical protein
MGDIGEVTRFLFVAEILELPKLSSVRWDSSTVAVPCTFMVYCQRQIHRWQFWAAKLLYAEPTTVPLQLPLPGGAGR